MCVCLTPGGKIHQLEKPEAFREREIGKRMKTKSEKEEERYRK